MPRKLSLIDNKVARRITISFILAALIPIGVLGLLSFQQVSENLRDQTAKSLHNSSKDYAMGLIDRLTLVESTLHLVSSKIEKSSDGFRLLALERQDRLEGQFANLAVIAPNGETTSLINKVASIPDLTEQDVKEIRSGNPVIKALFTGLEIGESTLWMAINLVESHPEDGILLGEMKPELIWASDNTGLNNLWVIEDTNRLLFASEVNVQLPPEIRARIVTTNSGQFTLKSRENRFVGAYWKIPMKGMFSTADMVIVLAQPEALAFQAIQQFGTLYPPIITLVVLIVAFFITRLIIKYLSPLDQLKTATLRIAEGDLVSRVTLNSKDEFEELADSFNEMTRRLRSQFDIMSAMAEIDRHILSSLNAEDIVETALNRLPDILYCDLISIAQVDPETYRVTDIHIRRSGKDIEIIKGPIKLNLQDVIDLLALQNGVIESHLNGALSAYLKIFGDLNGWRYLIIPVVLNGTLSSMICLGYQGLKQIPAESRSAARNFGDRIAVALSNAAWEEKLYHHAHYDTLTGLPNRLVLNDRLSQELARVKRDETEFAVFFIDLDRFKNVNDSLGHAAGDDLLVQVAKIFVDSVRETDLVVRLGGDEFVIVITDLHHNTNAMLAVTAMAEKILNSLKQTLMVAGHPMTFTASIGIAVYPGDADNVQDLLKNADAALYHAKDQGRANFRFYSSELNATALENMQLEYELRQAIGAGDLIVYYQPKVDSAGVIVGAEALLRWQHAELGMVSPAKFIPIAEQSGLIVEIGDWVLEQACLFIKSCKEQGIAPVRISVNLSMIEFNRPELVNKVSTILSRTGVESMYIELELTESVAIGEAKNCIKRMNDLKTLGIKLSMDDFGTGFSSLSYLKELPLDVLKIDQSFIRQLGTESNSQAIVIAILALANGLGMQAVAEGVETESQVAFLTDHDCGVFQGFLFHRPIPANEFLQLLTERAN